MSVREEEEEEREKGGEKREREERGCGLWCEETKLCSIDKVHGKKEQG